MNRLDGVSSDKCVGCSGCCEICPSGAISMESDEEGFLVPHIDNSKCVECGLCVSVCQIEDDIVQYESNNIDNVTYAVRHRDDVIRYKSASGAYFQALSESVLAKGGYICGCILDENLYVKHIVSNQLSDVRRMADSKYVQSDLNGCFGKISVLLKDDIPVLFAGTSCQVYGLKKYLNIVGVNVQGLITIDFFCHGVPSPLIWNEFLHYYEKKKGRKVKTFRWRCKEYGWGESALGSSHLNSVYYEKAGKLVIDHSLLARKWKDIFFSNKVLRRNCYNCKFCTVDKPADVTIGDFWKINSVMPEFNDNRGTSLAIVHNADNRGMAIEDLMNIEYKKCNLQSVIAGQKNAFEPSPMPCDREMFWMDYREAGFDYVMKKYYLYLMRVVKDNIKWIRFKLRLGRM